MSKLLFNKVTPIQYHLGDVRYRATGFFYRYAGEDYLITNRHVVEHEHGISPRHLRIKIKFKIKDRIENRPINLKLYDENNNEIWKTHPTNDSVDLAIIPLKMSLTSTNSGVIRSKHHVPQDTNLTVAGSKAIVTGVPGAIGAGESNSPMLRDGLISSIYGEPFGGNPCFIIDANLHQGMSGSPVFLHPNSMYDPSDESIFGEGFPLYFLGVHSGPVDQENYYGLHRVWHPNLIWDIISNQ